MKRKAVFLIIVGLIVLICSGASMAAEPGFANFTNVNTYENGQFKDVPSSAWYADNVATAYELGLMKGSNDTTFNAQGNITIGESIALASRLYSIYNADGQTFAQGNPWYQVYVDYVLGKNIIVKPYADYTKKATRAEFAVILAGALPSEALAEINAIVDGAIPDVSSSSAYSGAVYKLYRAGILTGNDAKGTFTPDSYISRNAVAAIVTRMADQSLRQHLTLKLTTGSKLSPSQIYQQCSPAVVYIEVYDEDGECLATGSGFFINNKGKLVTNYHVIAGASSAKVFFPNDDTGYDVKYICGFNAVKDIAILQTDCSNTAYLYTGDSDDITHGQVVYAIGSPMGYENTISDGIISNISHKDNSVSEIQTTAAISSGSSGSPLINEYGEAVGIIYASDDSGQNLNFALPINLVNTIKPIQITLDGLDSYISKFYNIGKISSYTTCSDVPDFGAMFAAKPLDSWHEFDEYDYYYYDYDYVETMDAVGFSSSDAVDPIIVYESVLADWGFESYYAYWDDDMYDSCYFKDDVGVWITCYDGKIEICVSP